MALPLLLFLLRTPILRFAYNRAVNKALNTYHVSVTSTAVAFSGFDAITVKGLVVQPLNTDTLLRVKNVKLNLSVLDLLTGTLGFDEIVLDSMLVTMYHEPQRNNISFLTTESKPATQSSTTVSYRKRAGGIKSKLLRLFNTAFHATDVNIQYKDSLSEERILIPKAEYDLHDFTATFINKLNNDSLQLSGRVLEKNKAYKFEVSHADGEIPYLPFLHDEKGLRCKFGNLTGLLQFEEGSKELVVKANVTAGNFCIGHWRLATEDVVLRNGIFNGKLKIGEESIELDSTSLAAVNGIKLSLFGAYSLKPMPVFQLAAHMPETVSDTFFNSLPQGMFNTLHGISCTGTLKYDLSFVLPTEQPDSLQFSSLLKRKDFTILHFGAENYTRINGPFVYEAFDKDRFVRNIEVSPANLAFTPLQNISPYLVKAVLQSEDPSFMQHNGFLEEAFRESIVKNYKEKRFARGGSTITMQLVKNVFLSRNKTVSRKAEEALIVYLIENLNLVSKERTLEVYLNVIEWGPNVYGIGEAARFYFNKPPSQLTLNESIFLAGIIPMPKYFKYQFDKDGHLRSYLNGYFRILSTRMVVRGAISPADTIGLMPDVELTGPARKMVVPDEEPETTIEEG